MSTIQTDLPETASSQQTTCSFDESDTRADDMRDQLDAWVADLAELTDDIGVDATIVAPEEWEHGSARGMCERRSVTMTNPVVEVVDRENRADLARTLIHEFAHALLHFERDPDEETSRLEVEAEAVAYIVSRHFGLDPDNSAFYLAAWDDDAPETLHDRLDRTSAREYRICRRQIHRTIHNKKMKILF